MNGYFSRSVCLIAASMLACAAAAQELSAEKEADIRRLINVTGAASLGDQFSTVMINQLTTSLRSARPDIPDRLYGVLGEEVRAAVEENVNAFVESIVPLYDKYFTQAEIDGLLDFYATDLGRKTVEVLPMLSQESAAIGQKWASELAPRIERRIQRRFREEGFEIAPP